MIKVPDYIAGIKPYVPGKPMEELERELGIRNAVKLASNENPIGPSPKAVKALVKTSMSLNRYPDGGAFYLRDALSKKLRVKHEELILGNGSNELLDIAARTFLKPGDEAVMASPSFVVYPLATTAQGAKCVTVPLKDMRHDLGGMADAITPKTRIVFIANPNNPTGTINTKSELDEFISRVPEGVLVVLDEAYYEYVLNPKYADSMKHFRAGRDVLILRTFSKIYGLAGLRIGYGIGPSHVITEMNKLRPPFNTSTPAQIAALAALSDERHVKRSVKANEDGKKYLYAQLNKLGVKYVPTEANFIYMALDTDSASFNRAMLKQGVIIRPMGPKEIRVTIGLKDENRRFIEAFKRIRQGG